MTKKCNKYTILFSIILCFNYTQAFSQVQWATQLIDFSSEYKDDLIMSNSIMYSFSSFKYDVSLYNNLIFSLYVLTYFSTSCFSVI